MAGQGLVERGLGRREVGISLGRVPGLQGRCAEAQAGGRVERGVGGQHEGPVGMGRVVEVRDRRCDWKGMGVIKDGVDSVRN